MLLWRFFYDRKKLELTKYWEDLVRLHKCLFWFMIVLLKLSRSYLLLSWKFVFQIFKNIIRKTITVLKISWLSSCAITPCSVMVRVARLTVPLYTSLVSFTISNDIDEFDRMTGFLKFCVFFWKILCTMLCRQFHSYRFLTGLLWQPAKCAFRKFSTVAANEDESELFRAVLLHPKKQTLVIEKFVDRTKLEDGKVCNDKDFNSSIP